MKRKIVRKCQKDARELRQESLLAMDLQDFLEYSGLARVKGGCALSYARGLIGNLCNKGGAYYYMRKRKVSDLYTLKAEDVFLKMKGYGVKTVEALSELLTKNGLPSLSLRLDDISYHPYHRQLHRS